MGHALILPLGCNPQIMSESLYLLHQHGIAIETLSLFTTAEGQQAVDQAAPVFEQLYQHLSHRPAIVTNTVVAEWENEVDDNGYYGRLIQTIQTLQNDYDHIYLCLTGGYKFLSFKLGYIFTLLARDSDYLFAVMMHHQVPAEFYFPQTPAQQNWISLQWLDFVRLKPFLPVITPENYNALIHQARDSLEQLQIRFPGGGVVRIGQHYLSLSPSEYVFYKWMCLRKIQGLPPLSLTESWESSYLQCYQQEYGINAYYERIERNLLYQQGNAAQFFTERKSRLNRAIARQWGKNMTYQLGVVKLGSSIHASYEVALSPAQIAWPS